MTHIEHNIALVECEKVKDEKSSAPLGNAIFIDDKRALTLKHCVYPDKETANLYYWDDNKNDYVPVQARIKAMTEKNDGFALLEVEKSMHFKKIPLVSCHISMFDKFVCYGFDKNHLDRPNGRKLESRVSSVMTPASMISDLKFQDDSKECLVDGLSGSPIFFPGKKVGVIGLISQELMEGSKAIEVNGISVVSQLDFLKKNNIPVQTLEEFSKDHLTESANQNPITKNSDQTRTMKELQLQDFYYHWQEAKKIHWSMDDVGESDVVEDNKEKYLEWEKKRIHVEPLYELVNHQLSDKELRDFTQELTVVDEKLLPYIDEGDHTRGRFQRLSVHYCNYAENHAGKSSSATSPLFVSQIDLWMAKLECEHPHVDILTPGRYVYIDHAKSCVRRAKENIRIMKSKSIYLPNRSGEMLTMGQDAFMSYVAMSPFGTDLEEKNRDIDRLEQEIERLDKKITCLEATKKDIYVRVNESTDPKLLFEPIFSNAFDSVRSRKDGNRDFVELSIMQMAAAGKTILLQGPQVADNIDILSLVAEEKISPLIEKGIITFSPYGDIYTPYIYFKKNIKNPKFDSVNFPFLVGDDAATNRRRESVLYALERPSKNTKNSMMRNLSDLEAEDRKKVEILYQAMQVLNQTLKNSESIKYYQSDAGRRLKNYVLTNSYNSMMDNGIQVSSLIGYRLTELEKEEEILQIGRADLFRRLRMLDNYMKEKKCHYRSDYYKALKFLKENQAERVRLVDMKAGEVELTDLEAYRGLVDRAYNVFQGYLSANHLDLMATENEIALEGDYDRINDDPFGVDYRVRNYQKNPIARRTTLDFENILEVTYVSRELLTDHGRSIEEIANSMEYHLGVKTLVTQNSCIAVTEANYKTSDGQSRGLSNEKSEGVEAFSNENIVNEGIR